MKLLHSCDYKDIIIIIITIGYYAQPTIPSCVIVYTLSLDCIHEFSCHRQDSNETIHNSKEGKHQSCSHPREDACLKANNRLTMRLFLPGRRCQSRLVFLELVYPGKTSRKTTKKRGKSWVVHYKKALH